MVRPGADTERSGLAEKASEPGSDGCHAENEGGFLGTALPTRPSSEWTLDRAGVLTSALHQDQTLFEQLQNLQDSSPPKSERRKEGREIAPGATDHKGGAPLNVLSPSFFPLSPA